MENIKKVYVIHKTHLDIGFTALAQDVLDTYVEEFIPKAIEVAYECNKNGTKNFVWTVGSYIIKYYLDHAKDPQKLIDAINEGYIAWHALPLTTHTEIMDAELLNYGINISKKLDEQFSKSTIACKMTDVPCHTTAIVPYLKKAGIRYMHIGINESSKPLNIPKLCVLKYNDDEIILNYAGDYGEPQILGDIALEFAHTADNMGPPTVDGVYLEINRLKEKYKNAEIISSTLDDFALEVLKVYDTLPKIDMELGDTWIHGASTDPYKIAIFNELLKIKDRIPNFKDSEEYEVFMENMLLVSEHTWGLDVKKWLYDFKNWEKSDFYKAREQDKTTIVNLEPSGELITNFILNQLSHYTDGEMKGSYKIFEQSWKEQRDYLVKAIEVLPEQFKKEIIEKSKDLMPEKKPSILNNLDENMLSVNGYELEIADFGKIKLLKDRKGKQYKNAFLGDVTYSVYSFKTVDNCYNSYNRNFLQTRGWSEPDFSKPALGNVLNLVDKEYKFEVLSKSHVGNALELHLKTKDEAFLEYGSPRDIFVKYEFLDDQILVNLKWFDKDANKMPEAIYFGFNFDFDKEITVEKIGLDVKPYNVLSGGNRKLHAVQNVKNNGVTISNLHSPLVCIGGKDVYNTDDTYFEIENGINFVLYNNRWNTNFRLWYEENAGFDFVIEL